MQQTNDTLFLFFFFFFCSTEAWTQGLPLEPLHQPFFVMGFFKIGSQELFVQTESLLISAAWIDRIISVSHQCLVHITLFVVVILVYFFGGEVSAADWIQDLTPAKQMLYHPTFPVALFYLFIYFFCETGFWAWLHACKAGFLPLEPHLQSILLWLFWRWGLVKYLPRIGFEPRSSQSQSPK
jgi:hypothetical protein